MFNRWRFIRQDRVELLLLANTFISVAYCEPFLAIIFISALYGQIYERVLLQGWSCLLLPFFMYIGAFSYFNSFALQAIYRCFRITHRNNPKLQSVTFYRLCTIILWSIAAVVMLILLLCGQLEYTPDDYHCQFSPTNLQASVLLYCSGFVLPFSVTLIAYAWTMYHVRKQTNVLVTINQNTSRKRDIAMLKRLVVLLFIINIAAAPHIVLPIAYAITRFLVVWTVSLTWFFTLLSVLSILLILLFTHPILRKLIARVNTVQPTPLSTVTH